MAEAERAASDGFHVGDGWHFERKRDGSVWLVHLTPCQGHAPCEGGHGVAVVLRLAADTWASVVAHTSARGGTAESFAEAVRLLGAPTAGPGGG